MSTDAQIEQEIQAKGLTAPRITPADIEANIASEHYFSAADGLVGKANGLFSHISHHPVDGDDPVLFGAAHPLAHVTICVLITKNGTKLVGANTGPVSPSNFDAELGRKLARQAAIDQLWAMLGYEMRSKLAGGVA